MILAYYGRWTSLEDIRAVAGVSRDGTKASNIVKAAAHYGLIARGVSCEPGDLATLTMPAIVFWNFNHYVVLEGRRRGRVSINDPAVGPRKITAAEFDQAFTGVVLTLEPGPTFQRGGVAPSLAGGLRARLRAFRPTLVAIAVVGFLMLVPGLIIPGLQRAFTDFYLVAGLHDWLKTWLRAFSPNVPAGGRVALALGMVSDYARHDHFALRSAAIVGDQELWDAQGSAVVYRAGGHDMSWSYAEAGMRLQVDSPTVRLDLRFDNTDEVIWHIDSLGVMGLIQQGPVGELSFCYSIMRAPAQGILSLPVVADSRRDLQLRGMAWIDRQ